MIWVLIVSELLVFGAGLVAFLAVRLTDPQGFAEAQDHLHRALAGVNTLVLVTSGWLAALARSAGAGRKSRGPPLLAGAAALGLVFLLVKAPEYADLRPGHQHRNPCVLYLLLPADRLSCRPCRGGHRALCADRRPLHAPHGAAGTAFWHMVDLVWVLLFPVVYLLR